MDIDIRDMREHDLDAVADLERAAHARPWSRGVFEQELTRSDDRSYVVAVDGEEIIGYGGIQFLGDDAHITNVVVRPDRRRRGIAARIVADLLGVARRAGATAATLEVRGSNAAALALYRRLGFAPVGVRRRYYDDPPEDALVMWLHDLDAPDGPAA